MRHYWFDRIIELEPGARAVAVKSVALSEDVFADHFPGNPVFPGIYLLEGLAQTGGVLLAYGVEGKRIAIMASIERARFTGFARPGDQVRLEVSIDHLDENQARISGTATVDGRVIASARLSFKLVDVERVIPHPYRDFWEHTLSLWRGEYVDLNDG
jgi:3-hydroxyacyl-[acyl-carrier-protein] dehydratase